MFGSQPSSAFLRFRNLPGVIDESGGFGTPADHPVPMPAPPGGGMLGDQPSTIHVTDPSRYGMRPALYGGGPMAQMGASSRPSPPPSAAGIAAAASPDPKAVGNQGGMFGAPPKKHGGVKIDIGGALMGALAGYLSASNPQLAQMIQQNLMYRAKKRDADAQTQEYVQALVARGVDPNDAVVMAADPQEMAKHFGTRYDAATIDEGSTRLIPNLNGSLNTYTAPKTFQNKADVVQMPGSAGVTSPLSAMDLGAPPQAVGAPVSIPGLRSEGEQYASSLGLTPGTPAYASALQDFELKGNGPTAFGFKDNLQSDRLANSLSIARGHDATSTANNRYSVDHRVPRSGPGSHAPTPTTVIGGIMDKQAHGTPLTPAEAATLKEYRTHYKPQRGSPQIGGSEPVAHSPDGHTIVFRNGAWVDPATGKPVH